MMSNQSSDHDPSNQTSLRPFNHLPDELLLSIFRCLDPFKRCQLLSINRKWNDTLLFNHSLWNSLVLDEHLSFEETLSILRLFNSRSDHQLKQVFLGKDITQIQDLIKIINELKTSAASLGVLGLVETDESLNRETRKLARLSFPKLNTLNLLGLDGSSCWGENRRMSDIREEVGINDVDEKMRYLCCDELLDLDEEERNWLSGLKYLEIAQTSSSKDLKSILKACKSSLEHLDLSTAENLTPSSNPENSNSTAGKIDLQNLKTLCIPWDQIEAEALIRMLGTTKGFKRLDGKANCLKHFNLSSVQRLEVVLYDEKDEIDQDLLNPLTILEDHRLLLGECKSVNQLTISCITDWTTAMIQLDVFFKLLLVQSKTSANPLDSGSPHLGGEEKEPQDQESNPVQEILLPHLVKLKIETPFQLDGKLLKQLVQSRKSFNQEFEIKLVDGDDQEIPEAEWEARGWMI